MGSNEIITKAHQLDTECDCEAVIELLEDYVNENKEDLVGFALYQKNLAMKNICDSDVSIEELMSTDANVIFKNVSEIMVFELANLLFKNAVASTYLSDRSTQEKEILIRGFIQRGVLSLGERLNDYNVLKDLLEEFYNTVACYGFENKFYTHLAYIVEWKSKVDENILQFIAETAKTKIGFATNQEIYDEYIKDKTANVFPYDQKPDFYGGKVVIVGIKTQEQADFWKGYFAFVKKIRQEEYETYKKNIANKEGELYSLYNIGKQLHDIGLNMVSNKLITIEDLTKMSIASGYDSINVSESELVSKIENAEKACSTVKVNPIEQIKSTVLKLFGKK